MDTFNLTMDSEVEQELIINELAPSLEEGGVTSPPQGSNDHVDTSGQRTEDEVKRIWCTHDATGKPCINVRPEPMGIGGHNIVLEGPRNCDMKNGVRRLMAEACPAVIQKLWELRTRRNGVGRVTLHDPDVPPSYVYMIYTRDRWEEPPSLHHYKRGLETVKEDLKKMGENEISMIRPPFDEETNTWNKSLRFLNKIFQGSGIQVNVYRDICRGDPKGIFDPEWE